MGKIDFLNLKDINFKYSSQIEEAIKNVLDSGWYINGKELEKFEYQLAEYLRIKKAVGVGNGFDALKLIFRALIINGSLHEGDEVIVPSNSFIASALAISETNLKPVFVDIDPNTYNLNADIIEKAFTSRTKAVLLVHLYGRVCFSEDIKNLCEKEKVLIVEDNAQAIGSKWNNQYSGSLGIAGAISFYPGKNLGALGDGGAVVTNNLKLAETIKSLSNYGSSKRYIHKFKGVNSRLDELQAAVLSVKLQFLNEEIRMRQSIANFYNQHINNPEIVKPQIPNDRDEHVWHLYVIRSKKRDLLQQVLSNNGIDSLIHYPLPIHKQEAYQEYNALKLKDTELVQKEIISIPLNHMLSERELDRVVVALNAFK